MKKLFVSIVTLIVTLPVLAQTPSELANSAAVQETQNVQAENARFPEDALTKSLTASLAKQGKSLGVINGDGSIYVIGSATTARPSNMSGFINSRNVAYSIAEMTAKMNLLRMAGEQITSGRGFQLLEDIVEGEDPDASEKAKELQNRNAVYSQDYEQKVKSFVTGLVQGCAVVRIAEGECGGDDYQVSVCVKYSPEFQSFASLIKNGGRGRIQMGSSRSSREKILSMKEADLVYRLGVLPTYNEQGEMVIYGFGQQEVRETGSRASAAYSRAYSQARLQAVNNIKNFVAEDIVAEESMNSVEKLREYNDGSNAYFSRQRWEQAVRAKATTLNIATEQVRQWTGVHPVSGTNVAGYIVCWTYKNAQQANQLRQQLDNNRNPHRNSGASNGARQQTTRGKIIITGEEEDL